MNIVEPSSDLDILEETHPEDSKDEHYEEEKKTNVEKSRKGHDQREEQSPDTLGSFDQPQHSAHLGNPGGRGSINIWARPGGDSSRHFVILRDNIVVYKY